MALACTSLSGTLRGRRAKHKYRTRLTGRAGSSSGCAAGAVTYASTWDAIQKTIIARYDCANTLCHAGPTPQGGLDLSPDAAYKNLVQKPSSEVPSLNRVEPGDERRSYLWLKLLAKTNPAKLPDYVPFGVQLLLAPMPNNTGTLTPDEVELVRQWIYATAPETGTVAGTQTLLKDACLPPAVPINAIPLDPPAPDKGIQFVMPPWKLDAHSQHELCFATYYDFTGQVPAQFADGSGNFLWNAQTLRQDPQSHHLILNLFTGDVSKIHDPAFGTWTCAGGDKDGQVCEPTDLTSCGSGICRSQVKETFACIGYGPQLPNQFINYYAIGGAQKAQADIDFAPGVWAPTPMKGILLWNPHAFNLTDQDTMMHGWLNYSFAQDRQYIVHGIFDISGIFAATGIPPYKTGTICRDYTFGNDAFGRFSSPQQAYVFSLSSHTHRHGEHFWVTDPQHGDQMLYENFVYNDPPNKTFDPPLVFNAGDKLHFCALYNNGLAADGSPDTTLVTRASRVPPNAPGFSHCKAVACVAGKMNPPAACTTNLDCDSSAGANDGVCDACPIAGGESTENEMFILIGQYFVK
ncbi:MAG: hypothetical protein E6J75_17085 [Deltaproteobacteria bacterium]|nr:MAG: hypothetical protein E6J75_17085 [Deltaproteobacteria bacterium]